MISGFILETSSLSAVEYILLVGQYNHILSGGKEEIDPAISNRGYTPAQLEVLKKNKRSNTDVRSCGVRFTTHLSRFKYPLFGYVSACFQNYERGLLPYPGSVSEQPNKIIEIFNVLSTVRLEHEKRIADEHAKKAKAMSVRR